MSPSSRRASVIAIHSLFAASLLVVVWVRAGWVGAVVSLAAAEALVFGLGYAYLRFDRRKHKAEDQGFLLAGPAARRTASGVRSAGRMQVSETSIHWHPVGAGALSAVTFDYSDIERFALVQKPFASSVLSIGLRGGGTEQLIAAISVSRLERALSRSGVPL